MKKRILVVAILCCLGLTGCELQTSKGTLSLNYDADKVSDETKFVDDNGKETVIHTESVKSYVDQLLENVELPQGSSTGDLKAFVYDSLSQVGIDLDKIDLGSSEAVSSAEDEIRKALESQGVDTTNLDIDIEQFMTDATTETSEDTTETTETSEEVTETTSENQTEDTETTEAE